MSDRDMESRVRELLEESYPDKSLHFEAGFADRVMARATLRSSSSELTSALVRQCRRVIPALLAASLALVAWNLSSRGTSDSALSAAFGLQPAPTSTESVSLLQGAEAFQ